MILDTFKMAVKSIIANKMRSMLTILGVVIGIASVIILVAIGEAAKIYVVKQMENFGMRSTFFQVAPGKDQGDMAAYLNNKLRLKHAEMIKAHCPSVQYIVPIIAGKAEAKYSNKKHTIRQAWGVTENYQEVFTHKLMKGRFFNKAEVDGSRKVCVIGSTVGEKLFGTFDPLDEKVKISGRKFTVIGVFEKKGKMMGQDMDDIIAMPITTASSLLDTKGVVEIDLIAYSEEVLPKAVKEVKEALLKDLSPDDFNVTTQEGIMSLINSIVGLLTTVVGGIAAISLLVGSIGIMNIMLVSVTERTKEIGIRKAVGARKIDIFLQFLVESIVISFVGGIFGIVLGLAGTFGIMALFNMGMVVVVWALTLACTVSIAIGIISGVYPAMRAVNLDPIEALRYE